MTIRWWRPVVRGVLRPTVAAALLSGAPLAAAQLPNPLEKATDPADRAVIEEVAAAVGSQKPDIVQLDALLAKLPRPTPLRGMVQTVRAIALSAKPDTGPAVGAIEEALRLLPDDPRPKLVAAAIFTFAGSPQRAADLWQRASHESPELTRMGDRYHLDALAGRLIEIGDRTRADRLRARLSEIGYAGALADERSAAELARTRQAIGSGQPNVALAAVTGIGNPSDLAGLYVDRRYEALWPRIAEWAGPDLSAQATRYLEELRSDWTAADDFKTAMPYARTLLRYGAHTAVVGLFMPMFDQLRPDGDHDGVEQLTPLMARSLATLGREAEARALLAKVAGVLKPDNLNALNVDGAYLTLETLDLDWPKVLERSDAFIAKLNAAGPGVNRSAAIQAMSWRACALTKVGRTDQAKTAAAELLLGAALAPMDIMRLHLCRGDLAAARAHLIARLGEENNRSWALLFVQPSVDRGETAVDRALDALAHQVRTAPDVLKAAATVGRVLPEPINGTLPAGFDPFRARLPKRAPADGI